MAAQKGRKEVEKKAQALERLSVQYVRCSEISPNAYNPNRQSDHDFHLLIRSMWEDGFTTPIVVQQGTGAIVDGEHRWTGAIAVAALRKRKLTPETVTDEQLREIRDTRAAMLASHEVDPEIPVVFVDMTPEQMRISTLRHNRARGSEDIELTAQLLRDLRSLGALDWAQDSLQLDDVELNRLLEDTNAPQALAAETFSTAWAPGMSDQHVAAADGVGQDLGQRTHAMTQAAVDQVRATEQRVAVAVNEEERQKARADADIYRLVLVFAGSEAADVRKVLGSKPADRLLELCRAAAEVTS